jgi:hypothetical protein
MPSGWTNPIGILGSTLARTAALARAPLTCPTLLWQGSALDVALAGAVMPGLCHGADGSLVARCAGGLAVSTIAFHPKRLEDFLTFCEGRCAHSTDPVGASLIREQVLSLEAHCNPGGTRGHFIAARAFFLWYASEIDDPALRNPIRKVKAAEGA